MTASIVFRYQDRHSRITQLPVDTENLEIFPDFIYPVLEESHLDLPGCISQIIMIEYLRELSISGKNPMRRQMIGVSETTGAMLRGFLPLFCNGLKGWVQ